MKRTYTQLALEEREKFYALQEQGLSLREIGRQLGRSHTSFSRERRRNIKYGIEYFRNTYFPCKAQELSDKRAKKQREEAAWKGAFVYTYIRDGLKKKWRPETIAGRLKLDHPEYFLCHETVYRMIYGKKYRYEKLWQQLILGRKKRMIFKRMPVLPQRLHKTMTVDNGSENTKHKAITQSMDMSMYFCHAYTSWEKPSVENMNGRVRRYIPKGVSIDTISEEEIAAIEWELNNTPRKCLGYKTPYEKLQAYLTR